jgi:hypothetical protein
MSPTSDSSPSAPAAGREAPRRSVKTGEVWELQAKEPGGGWARVGASRLEARGRNAIAWHREQFSSDGCEYRLVHRTRTIRVTEEIVG